MRVVDIKCTSRAETDWSLQVGGLQAMLPLRTQITRDSDYRYHGPGPDGEEVEYAPVTRLVRQLGFGKSWTGKAREEVVAHARERGKVIEDAIYRAFRSGDTDRLQVPVEWGDELRAWWPGFWRWLDDANPVFRESRLMAGDPEIRCAGEIDLVLDGDGPPAVLHLNPRFAKGYIVREYPSAVGQWEHVREGRRQELAAWRAARAALESVVEAEPRPESGGEFHLPSPVPAGDKVLTFHGRQPQ